MSEQNNTSARPVSQGVCPSPRRWISLAALVLFSGVFAGSSAGRAWPAAGTAAAFASAVIAGWIIRRSEPAARSPGRLLSERRVFLAVCAILLCAALLRLHRLGDVEGRMCYSGAATNDEGLKGNWAVEFLHGRPYSPFIGHWGWRETPYVFAESAAVFFFGRSVLTLRFISITTGLLTVTCLFLLTRRLFGSRRALIAAYLLGSSAWLTIFNRYSVRPNLVPLVAVAALWLLVRAQMTRRVADYALAGACLGFGMYSYPPVRILPMVVALHIVDDLVTATGQRRRRLALILVFAISAATLLMLPLKFDPAGLGPFISRDETFKMVQHRDEIWRNAGAIAQMLTVDFVGDMTYTRTGPLLQPIAAAFAVAGLGIAFAGAADRRYRLLLVWLLLGVIPGLLSEPAPRRLGPVLPLYFLFAAIGLDRCADQIRNLGRRWASGAAGLLTMAALLGIAAADARHVFITYYNVYKFPACPEYRRLKYIRSIGPYATVYLNRLMDFQPLLNFLTAFDPHQRNDWESQSIDPVKNLPLHTPAERTTVYVFSHNPLYTRTLPVFRQIYPRARVIPHQSGAGEILFHSVWLSPDDVNGQRGLVGCSWPQGTMIRAVPDPDGALLLPQHSGTCLELTGSLYSPESAEHEVIIDAQGEVEVHVDGQLALSNRGGTPNKRRIYLPRGLHRIAIAAKQATGQSQRIRVFPGESGVWPSGTCFFHPIAADIDLLAATPVRPSSILYEPLPPAVWTSPFTDAPLAPSNLEFASNGDVIVGDAEHVRIARYRADGQLIVHWNPLDLDEPPATYPVPAGSDRNRPFVMTAMPDGTIAVCADGTGNVVWFDHNGRASRVVAPVPVWLRDITASPDGDLYSCMGTVNRLAAGADEFVPLTVQHEGVARDPLSSIVSPDLQRLFVYDMETERILIMNRNAGYLNRIPNIGRLDGTRMAFTPDGNLAIAGQGLAVPAVFDPDGYLLTGPDENFNKGLFGSTPLPAIISDMAVDASGTIYIVLKSGEVLRFQPRPVTSRTVAR